MPGADLGGERALVLAREQTVELTGRAATRKDLHHSDEQLSYLLDVGRRWHRRGWFWRHQREARAGETTVFSKWPHGNALVGRVGRCGDGNG